MPRKKSYDITIRMRRKDGKRVTAEEAKRALWAAHKIAQHGGSITRELREWKIEAIVWRTIPGKEYTYDDHSKSGTQEVLENMGGILETLGLEGLRVAVPER